MLKHRGVWGREAPIKKKWRILRDVNPEGRKLESHTKTLMEATSRRNQLSPVPMIGKGFGKRFEALSYGKRGLGKMRNAALAAEKLVVFTNKKCRKFLH